MPGTHRGVKVARLGYPTKVYYTYIILVNKSSSGYLRINNDKSKVEWLDYS